jgi:hypothetical protein
MRTYAEDVEIAPIELMIVVRTVIYPSIYGQLMPVVCPGPPVSYAHPMIALSPYCHRIITNPQGFPLVQTSAAYLTFITLGGSPCVHEPP